MGFFSRVENLWKGFLSLFIEGLETENPEIVYEAAINKRIEQYQKLTKAVSGIVYLRNKLQKELEEKTMQLKELELQIPVAVQGGDEDAAVYLIQQKNTLMSEITDIKEELEKTIKEAEEAKSSLISFQGEIEKLKAEKESMLAKRENAKARIQINQQLSSLSTEADIKALDNVRTSIQKLSAQADVLGEIQKGGLTQKLKDIKAKTSTAAARIELEEIKKQMMAQKNMNIEKSM